MKNSGRFRKYVPSILLLLLFEAAAVVLWLVRDNLFYLLNFSYIGCCLALGTALFAAGKRYARHFVQLAVGGYMLLYLGVISRENMQIEGFWYYLFLGVFEAATIHYAAAKILGPLLFGRGWCGYACWTAMVLDFLPYRQLQKPRREKLGVLRYVKEKDPTILTKTGFMVGLGETDEQISVLMDDILATGCDILTIGQYLQPSEKHWKLDRYATPEDFARYKQLALSKGFRHVASAPLARSSYRAWEALEDVHDLY